MCRGVWYLRARRTGKRGSLSRPETVNWTAYPSSVDRSANKTMEMSPEDCVENVSRLLGCFPGVRVISAVHSKEHAKTFVRLSITSLQSLARIACTCNCAANVSLNIRAVIPMERGQPIDESKVDYSIVIPDDDGRGSFADPPGPLHILGAYLAVDLKHLGLLEAKVADELQIAWHCALR